MLIQDGLSLDPDGPDGDYHLDAGEYYMPSEKPEYSWSMIAGVLLHEYRKYVIARRGFGDSTIIKPPPRLHLTSKFRVSPGRPEIYRIVLFLLLLSSGYNVFQAKPGEQTRAVSRDTAQLLII